MCPSIMVLFPLFLKEIFTCSSVVGMSLSSLDYLSNRPSLNQCLIVALCMPILDKIQQYTKQDIR